jgi:hypothetical protein
MHARLTIKVGTSVMCPPDSVRSLSQRYGSTSDALTFYYFDVGHYLENTGNTTLHFLEIFDTGRFIQLVIVFEYHSRFGMWQIVSRISASHRYSKIDLRSYSWSRLLIVCFSGSHLRLRNL